MIVAPSLVDLINLWQAEKKLNLDVVDYSDTEGHNYGMLNDKMGCQFGNIFSDSIICQRRVHHVDYYTESFTLHAADPEFFEKLEKHIKEVRSYG